MKLPALSSRKVISKLQKAGFFVDHQTGSHVALIHKDGRRIIAPRHNRDLKKGTLRAILRQARLNVEEFIRLK